MSFYGSVLTSGLKERVDVAPSSTLSITSITLDTAARKGRPSQGVVQVWAKAADSSVKTGSIIGVVSDEAKKCHVELNIHFNGKNFPVEFWIVGGGQVHLVGTIVDAGIANKKDRKVSKKTKIEEVEEAEVPSEGKAPKNKKRKLNTSETATLPTITNDLTETTQEVEVVGPKQVNFRKFWRVKPQDGEGVLVKTLKPVYKTKDLKTVDYIIGNGDIPNPGATVKVVYTGMFPDGTVFDARMKRLSPFVFRKGVNQVVKGLDLGMEGMRVGGTREITIPPELG